MTRIGRERAWPATTRQQYEAQLTRRGALVVGSPSEVIDKILFQHEIFRHDRFLLQFSIGTMPHRQIMRCIELFGTEVAPAVRKALGTGPESPERPTQSPEAVIQGRVNPRLEQRKAPTRAVGASRSGLHLHAHWTCRSGAMSSRWSGHEAPARTPKTAATEGSATHSGRATWPISHGSKPVRAGVIPFTLCILGAIMGVTLSRGERRWHGRSGCARKKTGSRT
jgi:hypothetical protein